jgi:hypothetical protein
MNPNPVEPLQHGRWQRKCSTDDQRPLRVDVAYMLMLRSKTEEKKKAKAVSARTERTRLRILSACLLAFALALGILYIQRGVKLGQLSATEKQLVGIATLHRGYGAAFGKPPPSMQALKAWGEKLDKQKLAHFEIENVETLFVSERDGQPFMLVQLQKGVVPVLAHETTGAHGKRFVISSVGCVEELDEARFQQALETNGAIAKGPKGH